AIALQWPLVAACLRFGYTCRVQAEEEVLLAGEELARELEIASAERAEKAELAEAGLHPSFAGSEPALGAGHAPLSLLQSLLYAAGGIAGGLVFTMMNNALPLFLLSYSMPSNLPAFLNPGGAVPATIVALLTNERSLVGGLIQPLIGHMSDRTRTRIGKRGPFLLVGGLGTSLCIALLALQPPFWLM